MSILMVVLFALAASILVIWVLSALGILKSLLRAQRAAIAKGLRCPRLRLRDLSGIPWLAFLSIITVIGFVVMLLWYRLLGRPLPPPPNPWKRGSDG